MVIDGRRWIDVGQRLNGCQTKIKRWSNGCRMEVKQTSNRPRIEVGWGQLDVKRMWIAMLDGHRLQRPVIVVFRTWHFRSLESFAMMTEDDAKDATLQFALELYDNGV
ncbi:unnamed protein product [Sphagnum balticum]